MLPQIVRSSKSKNIRLTVRADGRVMLTVPKRASLKAALEFFQKKISWVENKLEFFKHHRPVKKKRPSRGLYLKYKHSALKLVLKKMSEINAVYNFKFNKVYIKNQSTRWGSCSKKGNLSFNFKILFLPENLQNYLVAHELCHLKEFNHSQKFWQLVAKTVPNYKAEKQALAHWSKPEILV